MIFIHSLWTTLCQMAPYLLFGFLIAGTLSIVISTSLVERHLGGKGWMPILKATMLGIPLPLCSCGVIPVGASLRMRGASKGATTSFLISTPQTGVDSIAVTYSLLGPVYAVFRPLAALVSGLLGGTAVSFSADREQNQQEKKDSMVMCSEQEKGSLIVRVLKYGFVILPKDIGRPLIIGIVLAAAISTFVPKHYFTNFTGNNIVEILAMMTLGIPLYVCATASVPIAAALIMKGISPGAALVFLMTGPATNAAAITTIWKLLGRRNALVYMISVAGTAFASGMVMNALLPAQKIIEKMHHHHQEDPRIFSQVMAVILILVVINALLPRKTKSKREEVEGQIELEINGMRCSHCAASIERALSECPGVKNVTVDFDAKIAFVKTQTGDWQVLAEKIKEMGYSAQKL